MVGPMVSSVPPATDAARVDVAVPAATEYLQLLRLNVAALAAASFDVDEIEDLKIAVEELASPLLSIEDAAAELHLSIVLDEQTLAVTGERRWSELRELTLAEYVPTILDAVVDDYELDATDDAARFRFEKRVRGG